MAGSCAKLGADARVCKSHAKGSHLEPDTPADHMAEPPPKPKHQPLIEWAENLPWTNILVAYLSEHTDFHIKLCSDLTAGAKKAGQSTGITSESLWEDDDDEEEEEEEDDDDDDDDDDNCDDGNKSLLSLLSSSSWSSCWRCLK